MKSGFVAAVQRACGVGLLLAAAAARAASFEFNWVGDAGYSTEGFFSYDATIAPNIISESGAGPTTVLDTLSVSFFDPSHTLLESFTTVSGGVSSSGFFQFKF